MPKITPTHNPTIRFMSRLPRSTPDVESHTVANVRAEKDHLAASVRRTARGVRWDRGVLSEMSPNSAHARMAYQPGVGSEVRIPAMVPGMRMAHVPRLVAKGTCDEAQSDEETVRRLDQAAGAADAAREVRSASGVACGSHGGACDPSQTRDAGRAPAAQLREDHYLLLRQSRRAIRQVLSYVPGSTQSEPSPPVSGVPVTRAEARAADGQAPRLSTPVLLREDAQAPLPAGGHPLSESSAAAPDDPDHRGSRPPDRRGEESHRSDDAHGPVLDRHAERRAAPPAGPRHRQSAHADSHSARQGRARSLRAAQRHVAGHAPRLLPLDAAEDVVVSWHDSELAG